MNYSRIAETVIEYTFYGLIFFVPIVFLPVTSELFEFNKMILVYFGASIIFTAWAYHSASERSISLKRTPLDIPILIFLAANIAATIFSIDRHESIFGHYSRFNGGLLSTVSYILLYYALVTFFDKSKLIRLLKVLLLSSAVVAVYAILQHPNPLFRNPDGSFRGIDAGYWKQNAQARAFSTLGHSNWLAAFLSMVIPFAFAFLVLVKKTWEKGLFAATLIIFFLAFTFAYSRGGTIGLATTILVLIVGLIITFKSKLRELIKQKRTANLLEFLKPPKTGFFLLVVAVGWIIIVSFFGNAFISRGVNLTAIKAEGDTQLASAGPETGRIRLIVWKGAVDISRDSPIFGSGVETFAYSYYKFRPIEHNYTSEWNFLYNKAHNEFVNYLATTGVVGLAAYLFLIVTFTIIVLIYLNQKNDYWKKIIIVSASAGYTGFHAQNLFGFSVVAIALLFFLTPAFFFILINSKDPTKIPLKFLKKSLFSPLAKIGIVFVGLVLVVSVSLMWLADFYYSRGISTSNYSAGYEDLKFATTLRPDEPLYEANLGLVSMYLAQDLEGKKRQDKITESFEYLNHATANSPESIILWRIRLQAIYDLATEEEKYIPQVVRTAQILGDLAPTEAETQYNLGAMYAFAADYKQAQDQLEKVVDLKFNYLDAWKLLFKVDSRLQDEGAQKKHFEEFERHFPDEARNQKFLNKYDLI
jgi:O-antigen ligase